MRRVLVSVTVMVALVAALVPSVASGSPSDPLFAKQWGLHKIQAEEAWSVADGTGAVIAIVDSGVDLTHPDLASKLIVHPDADMFEPSGSCETGGASKTCTQDGPQDANGHGTHVAGIAGAVTGNGTGVAGTAPGAQLLPVRVLDDDGDGTTRHVAAGIRYAADKGADVINLSISFRGTQGEQARLTGQLRPIYDALDYAAEKGAVTVVSAGNDGVPVCTEPAAAPRVLCVGATDRNDLRAYYSNGDATQMKNYLVAPGGDNGLTCDGEVVSTYLRGADRTCGKEDGYDGLSGTSMAAPFVSGVAALLAGQGLDAKEIISCIVSTTDDLGTGGRDAVFGYGRVNALEAVSGC